ncbi:beta-N-acetylhexosaminidase [Zavarzinia compransoris]|uniref:beta-N-acetylhexosaminidase n=1 Tax=Zavarzinia compransoris TaxID=1264899 RepID=A0A317E987_9PROT|nr:beta-N-acetylhexosaminidase [Zavarzinia compransoris]PWR23658.1 beta-N-acetylhexosaminidase [Zavarzinia compransoris]TDP47876.1 beta-N-acetylhexosaminidase [Zavarzinia compransoris]
MSSAEAAPRALIVGIAGKSLSDAERDLFRAVPPLGFILFARNIETPAQVAALVAECRAAVGRPDATVWIDQEGGRVARLRPPHWPSYYPAARLGGLDGGAGQRAVYLQARLIADDLARLGIDVDCHPCIDLTIPGAHDVIGDRALSADPATVADLGRAACEGLLDGGVLPVIKHLPGHGRALADSHHHLPVVDTPLAVLEATDFVPFKALSDMPIAMTAHIVFTAVDPDHPLTQSARGIDEVVRGLLGFDGVIVSDDLNMQALSGDLPARAAGAFAAGCDIALHCSGRLDELAALLPAAPVLAGEAFARWTLAAGRRAPALPFDREAARAELDALVATEAVA